MALPKKNKILVDTNPPKIGQEYLKYGLDRIEELMINTDKNTNFLPRTIKLENIDRELFNYINEGNLELIIDGNKIPVFYLENERWGEFEKTWKFMDGDKNVSTPYITLRRVNKEQGSRLGNYFNVPQNKTFKYLDVPILDDGQIIQLRFKIPQPSNVDVSYDLRLFTKYRVDVNAFDELILNNFASKQGYIFVKGNPMPVLLEKMDESNTIENIDGDKFYSSIYDLKVLGFIQNENKFEIVKTSRQPRLGIDLSKKISIPYSEEVVDSNANIYYVRPSGGIYGTEEGTSYNNAWNGFTNIDWELFQSGDILYICGTHTEALTVGASNVIIRGDYAGDAGIIDGQDSLGTCLGMGNNTNCEVIGLSIISAILNNVLNGGTSDNNTFRNCYFEGSGNQSAQHENTGFVTTYRNCVFENNTDDGISLHDGTHVYIYDCIFNNNGDGVNNDNTLSSEVYVYDCVFSGNTSGVRLQADIISIVERCIFTDNVNDFNIIAQSSTSPIINNSLFIGAGNFTINDNTGTVTVNDSYFIGTGNILHQASSGTLNFNRTLFYKGNYLSIRSISGNLNFEYCVFYNDTTSSEFAIWSQTATNINNCTFDGGGTGKGIRCVNGATIQNTIFTNLDTGIERITGTVTADHSNFFGTSIKTVGVVTVTNEVVGDPVIANEATLDFSLGIGSSCIGTGATLSEATGIDTADWGNGIDETPTVITKEQSINWNIGAYI